MFESERAWILKIKTAASLNIFTLLTSHQAAIVLSQANGHISGWDIHPKSGYCLGNLRPQLVQKPPSLHNSFQKDRNPGTRQQRRVPKGHVAIYFQCDYFPLHTVQGTFLNAILLSFHVPSFTNPRETVKVSRPHSAIKTQQVWRIQHEASQTARKFCWRY